MSSLPIPAFLPSALLCLIALPGIGLALPAGAQEDEAGGAPATNVLLVTLEATRADRLGCYGYERAHTPRLDALAAQGLRFERAYTHAPLTLPAHASILTGSTPLEHGVRDDARHALGAEPALLAEAFRAQGYRTGAFISSVELNQIFGLARGFEVYDDQIGLGIDPKTLQRKRAAREVARAAAAWLTSDPERPFFCWVQFADARFPCDPPGDARELTEDLYDASIAHMDVSLSWLTEALTAMGVDERTLIVVVGSMGEGLGEHGEATHGTLVYDSTLRVPLIVRAPGVAARGEVAPTLVGHADLAPSLLEFLGWPALEGASGASFAAVMRGEQDPHANAREVYFESEYAALRFGWSTLRGLVRGEWKFIRAPEPELYQLARDPGEKLNLAGAEAEVLGELGTLLTARIAAGRTARPLPLETPLIRRLSGIDSEPVRGLWSGAAPEGAGANPAERMAAIDGYHEALEAAYASLPLGMVAPLEQAVAASPDTASLHVLLAIAYERTREYAKSMAQLERALELDPHSATANYYMARMQIQSGQPEHAEGYFQLAAELAPDSHRAQYSLAMRLLQEQRFAEAVPYTARVCALHPHQPLNWRQHIDVLRSAGDWAGLVRVTAEASERFPDDLFFPNYQAWVLAAAPRAEVRDPKRALAIARDLAERSAMEDPGIIDTLAVALAATGDFDGAKKAAAKAIMIAHTHKIEPLLTEMRARLTLYNEGTPYIEKR